MRILHGLDDRRERRRLTLLREPAQRLRLDLPHPLAGDAHVAADLLQRLRFLVVAEAVAERITSCSRGGSVSTARCSASSPSATTTSFRPIRPPARRDRRTGVAVVPIALSRLATVRAAERASFTCFGFSLPSRRPRCRSAPLELQDELALRARDLSLALDDVHRIRMVRLFADARCTAWRIHQVAYVET